jgi:dolichyl-phosphate-mannose--protein O-mannosyl transferase
MSLAPNRIASLLFALSAVAPVVKWMVLLIGVVPAGQTALDHSMQMLVYVFGNPEIRWFFIVLALLPLAFLALSLATWRDRTASMPRGRVAKTVLGIIATAVALVIAWPAAITSSMATYYAHRSGAV